ncbi:hypothetical protein P3T32_002035 [Ralstonia sp. GP73]|uniref:DUF4062 domain-containing protein n=1 Tax=unclassified Ralstonia TaxID=209769 RepID=UPI002475DD6A|nr:DUF4062 domain-containing protein [Ralstonia sp. GP73]MDH6642193.1 hypothetical protein [Ralstonia sp. GP73]
MPPSIFVSSTFADLQRHRQLVREAIGRLEYGSRAMEYFGALPATPKEECLRLVRAADAYVGIFAMRYGFVDPQSGKSLTQLEYEEAQALHLPSLIYVIDEETHPVLPKHVDTDTSAEKLRDLKGVLKKSHVVNFFSSPEDLAAKVTQDVVRLVGAMANKPTAQVLSQLAANAVKRHPLTPPRFEYLKQRISGIFKHDVPDSILREALELVIAGEKLGASFVLSRGTPMPLNDAVDGLMEFDKVLIDIVEQYRPKSNESGDV